MPAVLFHGYTHSRSGQPSCSWKCHHQSLQAIVFVARVWIKRKSKSCSGERRGGRKPAMTTTSIWKWKKKVIFSLFCIIPIKLPLFITILCINPKADPYVNIRGKKNPDGWLISAATVAPPEVMWVFVVLGFLIFFFSCRTTLPAWGWC